MRITAIKTPLVTANDKTIFEIIDEAVPTLEESSILAVTSKIVSICEGSIVPYDALTKDELIARQSDMYLSAELSKYHHHFTITNHTLIGSAGIDESNGEGYYILWPKDSQATANAIRRHLVQKHGLRHVGVIITDSTCQPLRIGTTGISLAHSGFLALHNYVNTPDLFGRPLVVTKANIAGGLAAATVLAMGEGNEQTPLCLVSELSGISFSDNDPLPQELTELTVDPEDDLFAPFLSNVAWKPGTGGKVT